MKVQMPVWIPVRYIFSILAFIGFVFNYTLRINMNLVITSMVNHTALDDSYKMNSTKKADGPFVWDTVVTGDVVGMFFAGYMVFQMPGGRMAEVFGGKKVLAAAMGGVATLTLLIPSAAHLGGKTGYPYYLVIIRVLMGLCEAGTFPCITSMLARWAPEQERATMSTFIMAGSQAGTIVGFFISGLIVDAFGWESVFYIEGGACFVWLLLWLLLAADTPSSHPTISSEEREYIENGLPATNSVTHSIPWRSIWTSVPFWAIMFSNFANNWGFHLLMTELPQYLSFIFPDYMNSGSRTGLWTAIPYASMWAASIVFSIISDFVIKKNILSTAITRKIFNTVSHFGPAVCLLIIVIFVSNDETRMNLTLGMFTVGVAMMGGLYSGFITNPQDIAPNFAGTILGLTNCIGSIPGFVAPLVASAIVNGDEDNIAKWRVVWIIAISILVVESIAFIIFAQGNPQSWNAAPEEKETEGKKDWILIIFTTVIAMVGVIYVSTFIGIHSSR